MEAEAEADEEEEEKEKRKRARRRCFPEIVMDLFPHKLGASMKPPQPLIRSPPPMSVGSDD